MEFYRHRSYRPFWKWDTPCLFGETRHLLCVWISALPGNINLSMQPRTCREFLLTCNHVGLFVDTTPHMRGILFQKCVQLVFARYSPAHAGNPRNAENGIPAATIQPRTCGESPSTLSMLSHKIDTTPHMRGIPRPHSLNHTPHRYNPAHAGNPFLDVISITIHPIQPRTCGESSQDLPRSVSSFDTAPHMQGILWLYGDWPYSCRYSPAHAGNPRLLVVVQS